MGCVLGGWQKGERQATHTNPVPFEAQRAAVEVAAGALVGHPLNALPAHVAGVQRHVRVQHKGVRVELSADIDPSLQGR